MLWPSKSARKLMETIALSVLTRDEMEQRRLLAAADLQGGISQSIVARKFGVSRTTASRWCRAVKGYGLDALRKRRAPGRPCRLSQEQFRDVARIYEAGPRAAGFDTERWTTARFADAIFARFGVRYDPDHAGRIMQRLGLRQRAAGKLRRSAAPYTSRYSPNTALGRSEISPPVA